MKVRRNIDTSGLAFLDIMSCGLGAVVLLFMLIKHNVTTTPEREPAPQQPQSLQEDISALQARREALENQLRRLASDQAAAADETRALQTRIARIRTQLGEQDARNQAAQKTLQSLQQSVAGMDAPAPDPIALEGTGEEDYLLGLRVQGQRIAILLDNSASMTAQRLVDVITIKSGSDRDKKRGDKWRRAQRVLAWLLARVPADARLLVMSYNDRARPLGKGGWTAASGQADLQQIVADAQALVPEGGTNLQAGLQAISAHRPSHLYLITDGLPTRGTSRYGGLNPFARCSSLRGAGKTISGACRSALFTHTIQNSGLAQQVQVNVILLPIEGDPGAADAYWHWSARRGGLTLSPAPSWP